MSNFVFVANYLNFPWCSYSITWLDHLGHSFPNLYLCNQTYSRDKTWYLYWEPVAFGWSFHPNQNIQYEKYFKSSELEFPLCIHSTESPDGWVWKAPLEGTWSNPPAQTGTPTANFPHNFWVSPVMETPQLSGQPVLVLGVSQSEKVFSDVQMLK